MWAQDKAILHPSPVPQPYAYARANTRTGQELERVFGQQSTGTAGCSCEAAAAAGSVDKAPRVADRRDSELLRERLSH
jgi:hypothetical protein